jgi:P-type Mg2+ transporter
MLVFGPLSSVFDFLTFAVLLWGFGASAELFRTGWFIESVASQALVIFVVRTAMPMLASRPHPGLVLAAFGTLAVAVAIPFSPLAPWLGFTAPHGPLVLSVCALVVACLVVVEITKRRLAGHLLGYRARRIAPPTTG